MYENITMKPLCIINILQLKKEKKEHNSKTNLEIRKMKPENLLSLGLESFVLQCGDMTVMGLLLL
jgi:hypothetical protein